MKIRLKNLKYKNDYFSDNPEAEKLLQLNSSTGLLTLRKPENEDKSKPENFASLFGTKPRELVISIRVSDSGNPPHQSELPVHLQILGQPGQEGAPPFSRVPQFGQLHFLFAVAEDAPVGFLLGQLQIKNGKSF